VNKVPVTVLSRCQRFDLRRISADTLAAHFAGIAEAEGVSAEPEALALIARAAEGSVRDGLSILDQAIANADMEGQGRVTAAQLREMLGLSDRGAVRRLFRLLVAGDAPASLAELAEQRDLGVDPSAVMRGLLEVVHGATLAKVGGPDDPARSDEERAALEGWAGTLSFVMLHRIWQLLLKGHDEVSRATEPHQAADMALLRVIHASQLPDPGDLARKLESGAPLALAPNSSSAAASGGSPTANLDLPADFPALVRLLESNGKPHIAQQLHDYAGLVRYAPPELVIRANRPLPSDFSRDLAVTLRTITGAQWAVSLSDGQATPSLLDQQAAKEEAARDAILADPAVKAVYETFPEAELVDFTKDEERALTA
jgi:DNA polymerase-3 subunit gamma/tau